jgi:hypothetical protein
VPSRLQTNPANNHIDLLRYLRRVRSASRGLTTVEDLRAMRDTVWHDLSQIQNLAVRNHALVMLAEIMRGAEGRAEDISNGGHETLRAGFTNLIGYLEANDHPVQLS